jgi:cyclic-di-GMP-binding protein
MLGLSSRAPRDNLADAKAVDRWLAPYPANDPMALQRDVVAELAAASGPDARRTPARLAAVFHLDARTAGLRRSLAQQYVEHAGGDPRIETQLWSALYALPQAFLQAYQAFGRDIREKGVPGKWVAALPQLIARQIMHLALDAKARMFRYERWIPAKWGEAHTLFALACSRQLERQSIVLDDEGSTTTIEREYTVLLVLALVDVGSLAARDVEWVWLHLREWCSPLRFAVESSGATFVVDLGEREGLRRRGASPLEGHVLFLDTRPLHALLLQNRALLEQKIRAEPLSDRTPKRAEQLALVDKLAAQVDPDFRPQPRRGERTAVDGAVDAIVGFAKISAYLRDEEREPVPRVEPGRTFGGSMEIAVFGHQRHDRERDQELVRHRLAAYATEGGPWQVRDVSRSGLRLVAPMGAATSITLGMLAALRPQDGGAWMLGVVRRMRRLTADRAEVGLQLAADALVGVDLIEPRRATDDESFAAGGAETVNGRVFQGLFLALRKRAVADARVQSVIVPAKEYQPGRRLKLQTSRGVFPVRFGRAMESQPGWVWATIESPERASPLPAIEGEAPPRR